MDCGDIEVEGRVEVDALRPGVGLNDVVILRGGEIDRVYRFHNNQHCTDRSCIAEIKTILCMSRERFFTFFTESGLSSLIKPNQIANLYKYAEHLNAARILSNAAKKIYVRFFIVLKLYEGYEREYFFKLQKTYKVCMQTKETLILSFVPEFRVARMLHKR